MPALRRPSRRLITLALVALALVVTAATALAQSGGGYDLSWSTIDGGGGTSANGGYSLSGTIGQADAGMLAGGGYTLLGGFWEGGPSAAGYQVYLPSISR